MSKRLDSCLAVTGRQYPEGYGFALCYLDDRFAPIILRDAACALVGEAYGPNGDVAARKDSDLVAFVNAYANSTRVEHYLVEAAQLCLGWAMAGDPIGINAMRLCGHPGY